MNIALVVGHNSKKGGAFSCALSTNEFNLFSKVAEDLASKFSNLDVFYREEVGSYTKEMSNVLNSIHKKKYDLVLELHFNASNKVARGTEVLRWHNSVIGKEYSEKFVECTKKFNLPFRKFIGIKSSSENGGHGIAKCKYPYLLLEPFFGDNAEDCKLMNYESIVELLTDYLKYVGLNESLSLEQRVEKLELQMKELKK